MIKFEPIETAPKDGTDILALWFEDGVPTFSGAAWVEWDDGEECGWYSFDDLDSMGRKDVEYIMGPLQPQFWVLLEGSLPDDPASTGEQSPRVSAQSER